MNFFPNWGAKIEHPFDAQLGKLQLCWSFAQLPCFWTDLCISDSFPLQCVLSSLSKEREVSDITCVQLQDFFLSNALALSFKVKPIGKVHDACLRWFAMGRKARFTFNSTMFSQIFTTNVYKKTVPSDTSFKVSTLKELIFGGRLQWHMSFISALRMWKQVDLFLSSRPAWSTHWVQG